MTQAEMQKALALLASGRASDTGPVAQSSDVQNPFRFGDVTAPLDNGIHGPQGVVNFGMLTGGVPVAAQSAPDSQKIWTDDELNQARGWKYREPWNAGLYDQAAAAHAASDAAGVANQKAYDTMQGSGMGGGIINAQYGQSQTLANSPWAGLWGGTGWTVPQVNTGAGAAPKGSQGGWGGPWTNQNPFGSSA